MQPNEGRTSSWQRILSLPEAFQEKIRELYRGPIQLEVRIALTDWIDEHDWHQIHARGPDLNVLSPIAKEFFSQLHCAAMKAPNEIIRRNLLENLRSFILAYAPAPAALIWTLLGCVVNEREVFELYEKSRLLQAERKAKLLLNLPKELETIREDGLRIARRITEVNQAIVNFIDDFEGHKELRLRLQRLRATDPSNEIVKDNGKELEWMHGIVSERARYLYEDRLFFIDQFSTNITTLENLMEVIVEDKLMKWKKHQQAASYGELSRDECLDDIQVMYKNLMQNVLQHREILNGLDEVVNEIPTTPPTPLRTTVLSLRVRITKLIDDLVRELVVIEEQPPQVIHPSTPIDAQLRFFFGDELKDGGVVAVRISVINEKVEAHTESGARLTRERSGVFLENEVNMYYYPDKKTLLASLRSPPTEKLKLQVRGLASWPAGRFCLLFETFIRIRGMSFHVGAFSLPVMFIRSQDDAPLAEAAILWDNAFSQRQKERILIPYEVRWCEMSRVLSSKFCAVTGGGLTDSDIHFLTAKLFRLPIVGDEILSYVQFALQPLPRTEFPFWEWFYAIMQLCRNHLKGLWKERSVWGFVTRKDAQKALMKKSAGTFLVRFSDNKLAAVSIAWVHKERGKKLIAMGLPLSVSDLQDRSLADRLSDCENFQFLYPNIPKDQVLQKFSSASASADVPVGSSKAPNRRRG